MMTRRRLPCHREVLDQCRAAYWLWRNELSPVYIRLHLEEEFPGPVGKSTLYRWVRSFENGTITGSDLNIPSDAPALEAQGHSPPQVNIAQSSGQGYRQLLLDLI